MLPALVLFAALISSAFFAIGFAKEIKHDSLNDATALLAFLFVAAALWSWLFYLMH